LPPIDDVHEAIHLKILKACAKVLKMAYLNVRGHREAFSEPAGLTKH
jgi:hypothetical protein